MGIQINGQTDTISAIDGGITVATDLTVPGALTYDDVTNIDSVGVITARSGIHVTGGNVGIGTDESYGDGNASFSSLSLGGNGTKFGLLEINKSDGTAGSWIDCYGTGGNGDLRITTAGTSGAITFWTGGSFTEKLRITSSGDVGIGTDNPSSRLQILDIDGTTTITGTRGSGHSYKFETAGVNAEGFNIIDVDNAQRAWLYYAGANPSTDSYHTFNTNGTERLRITSDGHLVYDTNKGGIYNFDKACGSNTTTNIFRIDNTHGAHCFTIYMTGANSGNSVSKIYHVACKYGTNPTINSAADTGAYSSNNFSLTGSVSGSAHTFAITTTGAAATVACTVVLGSMNTLAGVTVL